MCVFVQTFTLFCIELYRQTEIYRKVFHAIPDDLITTWKQYKDFMAHHERLNKPVSQTVGILNLIYNEEFLDK